MRCDIMLSHMQISKEQKMKIEMKGKVGSDAVFYAKLRDGSKDEQQRLNECWQFLQECLEDVDKTKRLHLVSICAVLFVGLILVGLQGSLVTGMLWILLLLMNFVSFHYCKYCFMKDIHLLCLRDCIDDWEKKGKPTIP